MFRLVEQGRTGTVEVPGAIVIPQSYHAVAAAQIGQEWGNSQFDRPQYFASFLDALAVHHLGAFGMRDNIDFRKLTPQEQAEMFWNEIHPPITDPVALLHVLFHNERLLRSSLEHNPTSHSLQAVYSDVGDKIHHRLSDVGIDLQYFEWVDSIIEFCDKLSFDMCTKPAGNREMNLYRGQNSQERVKVGYSLDPGRNITVSPWPFGKDRIPGILHGFRTMDHQFGPPVQLPFVVSAQESIKEMPVSPKENPDPVEVAQKFIRENQAWMKAQTLRPDEILLWANQGVNLHDQKRGIDNLHHSLFPRWDYDIHTSIEWE